jgi:membrane protein GlpM
VNLAVKALLGAAMVVLISVLSRTRSFYVAGLVPLFPTFALISHWIVGSERTVRDLRATILFGMLGVVPYLAYLVAMYLLVVRVRLATALVASTGVWLVVAGALVASWSRR